ncbi:hypothetical protein M434DRAFT_19276 [Hypoxylon sp. CO27-5]|nr:hypothetical protein M434DRAFT_19276 [Hypoxylon sp. CO27-5]
MNPRSLPYGRKWLVILVVSVSALDVTFTSSVYTSTFDQITQEFGVSNLVATVGLSLYLIGLALCQKYSEFYGRRPIYLVSFTFFLIWLVPEAAAKNIATRLLGPSTASVVGGFINQYTSWRWTFYILIIWSAIDPASIALLVPETYHPILLRNKARKLRKDTGTTRWIAPIDKKTRSIPGTIAVATRRPFELLIFEPMCLNLCIFYALLLGIVYLFFGVFNVVFSENYGFELWQQGLTFLGLFVGMLRGAACAPIVNRNYVRLVNQREATSGELAGSELEYRLPPASILAPARLFMFAWTFFPSVHWVVPIIGSVIFGMGRVKSFLSLFTILGVCLTMICYTEAANFLIFTGIFTFKVEIYPLYAASALAANTFLRCALAMFPLFGIQMYRKLGDHWATSLLAFLTLAMMPLPCLFFRYGSEIRKKNRFASA